MIRYTYALDLDRIPDLAADMFRDRTTQFRDRMGWDVTVDDLGWETDEYDAMDPLYVIAEDAQGCHAGSMRFLPTTGPTMLGDVFGHLMGGAPLRSPVIWECTRFCLSPEAGPGVARKLLIAACRLGLDMGLSHSVAVFDDQMARVYRRLGWAPEIIGSADGISAGIWAFTPEIHDDLCRRAGIEASETRRWFEAAFGDLALSPAA
ncbi:MAG: acyl-homoserine-lactone synthase [Pseudomonadota bacterium]